MICQRAFQRLLQFDFTRFDELIDELGMMNDLDLLCFLGSVTGS